MVGSSCVYVFLATCMEEVACRQLLRCIIPQAVNTVQVTHIYSRHTRTHVAKKNIDTGTTNHVYHKDTTALTSYVSLSLQTEHRPASWSSGQSSCLLIMRSRVRFPALPWKFSLKGRIPAGRLVEFRFKGPPGTTSSYITTHIIGTT